LSGWSDGYLATTLLTGAKPAQDWRGNGPQARPVPWFQLQVWSAARGRLARYLEKEAQRAR